MKRYLLAVLTGLLVIGGAGVASGASAQPVRPPKPPTNPGDQSGAMFTAVPLGDIGTRNGTIKREYTELATPCRLYDSRSATPLASGSTRTIPLSKCPAISPYATSLTVSLSAVGPTHPG